MVRSLRPTGPGISGLKFFSALCPFVERYWIVVRNITGDSPESPAPLDRNLRSAPMIQHVVRLWCLLRKEAGAWPESPAQAGVSGALTPESPI